MGKYIIKNAKLLTGELDQAGRMVCLEGMNLVIDGEKILDITRDATLYGNAYEILNMRGKYILPGLINCHVHMVPANKVKKGKKPMDYDKLGKMLDSYPLILKGVEIMLSGILKQHLYAGVTTIRSVGGLRDLDAKLRDRVLAGKLAGPRMLVSNTGISVTDGHMAGLLATRSDDPETALKDLAKILSTDPDWIKLMVTGGVLDAKENGEPGLLRMDPAIIRVVCDRAHEAGLKVCAHTESTEGVRAALLNGVDTIEHGAMPDEEILSLFEKNKAADICTLSPAAAFLYADAFKTAFGEKGEINGNIVQNGIIACAKACMKRGIPVGLGTDCGCPFTFPYDMWRELVYFVKLCGVTPDQAIHTATLVNAGILSIDGETGSIAKGKCADLMIVDADPREDLSVLRSPLSVFARGKLYDRIAIRKDKEVEEELDRVLMKL